MTVSLGDYDAAPPVVYEVDEIDHQDAGWPNTALSAHEGQTVMFDGDLLSSVGLTSMNDVGTNWCFTEHADYVFDESPLVTGEHNIGTPGVINPTCTEAAP